MLDSTSAIDVFLQECAARKPTPGGGAVTALTGALAVSMGEMVINYSVGKKGLEAYVGELKPALDELTRARALMLQLMAEDQLAYDALTAARKLPADHPEKATKTSAALLVCIRVPQSIAATAVSVLDVVDRVRNFVNPYLLSDLAVCADLSMATARCAVYNVRANLPQLTDPAERARIESSIAQLLNRAATCIEKAAPEIWERFAREA